MIKPPGSADSAGNFSLHKTAVWDGENTALSVPCKASGKIIAAVHTTAKQGQEIRAVAQTRQKRQSKLIFPLKL
jgi:hypothetical protein